MDVPDDGPAPAFRPDFVWESLAERLSEALGATSLDTLCRQAAIAELPRARPDAPMYFI